MDMSYNCSKCGRPVSCYGNPLHRGTLWIPEPYEDAGLCEKCWAKDNPGKPTTNFGARWEGLEAQGYKPDREQHQAKINADMEEIESSQRLGRMPRLNRRFRYTRKCTACKGSGKIKGYECQTCGGDGEEVTEL